jgi:carboxyl-terminal processing protease
MFPKWIKFAAVFAAIVLVAAISFGAGFGLARFLSPESQHPVGETPDEYADQFRVFWEAWNIVEGNFYHPENKPNAQDMTYGAIKGALASLGDPYTSFAEPVYTAIIDQDLLGSFDGIGATVNMQDGRIIIVRPLDGSPAERAGLLPGDLILEVDGVSILGMNLLDAIGLIRGPEGTSVRLTVVRPPETESFEVEITRQKIDVPTVESQMLDDDIAYLRLTEFNSPSAREVQRSLQQLLDNDPKGLVFDLRSNPGGYLRSAIDIGSQFIQEGLIIVTERDGNGRDNAYYADGKGLATEIPLAVLVDGGTASASEIVAGAIQDHGRGVLIGEQTVGKGSVQTSHHLSDGSSVRVTISRWYTPSDHQLDSMGLVPDIVVEMTPEDIIRGEDLQLERAQEYLLELLRDG